MRHALLRLAPVFAILLGVTVGLAGSGVLAAATTAASTPEPVAGSSAAVPPVLSCPAVAQLDLPGVAIASATLLAASDNHLGNWAACDVKGVIAPQTQFELLLPTATWQQRYLQAGCGGYCGNVTPMVPAAYNCMPLTNGEFAIATDNEGHFGGSAFDGTFGTDPQLRVEFGYLSEHQLAGVAKQIIARFYGQAPTHSYYDGCSQGGHEGLIEAQRYPHDFDGIVAGAPASIMTPLNIWYQAWNTLANLDAHGNPVLTVADLTPLHNAVLNACDAQDGTVDGLLADPLACTWDPGSIACAAGQQSTPQAFCLTPAQVTTVRKLYEGPRDERDELMYPGWQLRGSELNWAPWIVPAAPGAQPIDAGIVLNTIRYLVYPDPRPELSVSDVQFTSAAFTQLMRGNAGIYDATDPDLSAFQAAGGKLILWHGWADPGISPMGTVAYYQAVQDRMGGPAQTAKFARLFMLPGVAHCGGGDGPDSFDGLDAMVGWVEHGTAPDSLVTSKVAGNGTVTATRPVYQYPLIAVDTTGGPVNQASSYTARPAQPHDAHVRWLGSFSSGYELDCGWQHGEWVCQPARKP